jgi:hypothetical protein
MWVACNFLVLRRRTCVLIPKRTDSMHQDGPMDYTVYGERHNQTMIGRVILQMTSTPRPDRGQHGLLAFVDVCLPRDRGQCWCQYPLIGWHPSRRCRIGYVAYTQSCGPEDWRA